MADVLQAQVRCYPLGSRTPECPGGTKSLGTMAGIGRHQCTSRPGAPGHSTPRHYGRRQATPVHLEAQSPKQKG